MTAGAGWTAAAAMVTAVVAVHAADPAGTPQSQAALRRCHASMAAPPDERAAGFAAALALAEQAVAADDRDALAHFALFCALGGTLKDAGLGVRTLFDLRRLQRAIDRTLALAPDFPDALAGKGALLLDLPRLLGGDRAQAERHLRHALALDPDYLGPRLDLARALHARGAHAEARAEAERALAIATRKGDREATAIAEALLVTP